jgi:hypothetical protein
MTVDLDSTVCQVHGYRKQGAAHGYTHELGYHPLLATRADTGEVLHARQRTGRANTARGAARVVDKLVARVRRAGASGELTMRADSGFWSAKTVRTCRRYQIRYSITVRQTKPIRQAIAAIDEDAWTPIAYPDGGVAQVAETRHQGDRLIVCGTRLVGARARAIPELALPRLCHRLAGHHRVAGPRSPPPRHGRTRHPRPQAGAGLCHCPSGVFGVNAAWLLVTTLAHNLLRWVAAIGQGARGELVVARALFSQHLDSPEDDLAGLADDPFALDEAIAALRRFALVKAGEQTLAMHRLVQQVLRHQLDPKQHRHRAATALRLISAGFPADHTNPDAWPTYARLLPHALAVTGHAQPLGIELRRVAWLLNEAGLYLWKRADHPQARSLFERALSIREMYLGANDLDTAKSLNDFALIVRAQGDLGAAHPCTSAPKPSARQLRGGGEAVEAVQVADGHDSVQLLGDRFDPYPHVLAGMAGERQAVAAEDASSLAAGDRSGTGWRGR